MSNFSEDCDLFALVIRRRNRLTVMSNFSEDCDTSSLTGTQTTRTLTVMSNFSEDCDKGISEFTISDCGMIKPAFRTQKNKMYYLRFINIL
jgi:hypothetical protein